MGYVLKRLALGIVLVEMAAAVLLLSDWRHRQRARPSRPVETRLAEVPASAAG